MTFLPALGFRWFSSARDVVRASHSTSALIHRVHCQSWNWHSSLQSRENFMLISQYFSLCLTFIRSQSHFPSWEHILKIGRSQWENDSNNREATAMRSLLTTTRESQWAATKTQHSQKFKKLRFQKYLWEKKILSFYLFFLGYVCFIKHLYHLLKRLSSFISLKYILCLGQNLEAILSVSWNTDIQITG